MKPIPRHTERPLWAPARAVVAAAVVLHFAGGCVAPSTDATAPGPAAPADLARGPAAPRCPDETAQIVRAALDARPAWRGRGQVRIVPVGRSQHFSFAQACLDDGSGESCESLVIDDACAGRRVAEHADALQEALPKGASEFIAIETLYPELPLRPGWDPRTLPGLSAPVSDYTMQWRILPGLLLYQLLVHIKLGRAGTGLIAFQLGGAAAARSGPHENAPWSFVIRPESVETMRQYEECDTWPAYIEGHLQDWLRRPGAYTCPWSFGVIALLYRDDASGERRRLTPVDYG